MKCANLGSGAQRSYASEPDWPARTVPSAASHFLNRDRLIFALSLPLVLGASFAYEFCHQARRTLPRVVNDVWESWIYLGKREPSRSFLG